MFLATYLRGFPMRSIAFTAMAMSLMGCASLHPNPYGMEFTSSKCRGSADIRNLSPAVSSRWSGETFIVDVSNPIICNADIVHPSYTLDGPALTVSYEAKLGWSATKCYCNTHSTYRFSRLPVGNYQAKFLETD
jgi:hypothetical protein